VKFDVDIHAGTVTAVYGIEEFRQVLRAVSQMQTEPEPEPEPTGPVLPKVFTTYVGDYTQVIVTEPSGYTYRVCSCDDFRYRRQSPPGKPADLNSDCKHITVVRYSPGMRAFAVVVA
jgi:hypothetical protein